MRGTPATFGLGDVIAGWTEGVQLMVVGEKTRFWIPEELAYKGKSGVPSGHARVRRGAPQLSRSVIVARSSPGPPSSPIAAMSADASTTPPRGTCRARSRSHAPHCSGWSPRAACGSTAWPPRGRRSACGRATPSTSICRPRRREPRRRPNPCRSTSSTRTTRCLSSASRRALVAHPSYAHKIGHAAQCAALARRAPGRSRTWLAAAAGAAPRQGHVGPARGRQVGRRANGPAGRPGGFREGIPCGCLGPTRAGARGNRSSGSAATRSTAAASWRATVAPPRLTRYRVLARSRGDARGLSLVRCELVTGRTHQLRVHLAARGWPIVGDPAYGEAPRARVPDAALDRQARALRPPGAARLAPALYAPVDGPRAAVRRAAATRHGRARGRGRAGGGRCPECPSLDALDSSPPLTARPPVALAGRALAVDISDRIARRSSPVARRNCV